MATNLSSTLLDPLIRDDPMGPRITYYDDATGERIELSAVTLVNWAAKTANLLRDELGAGPRTRVAVLLPAHWQTAAVLFGIWYVGAEVVLAADGLAGGSCDLAMCTADRLDEADQAAGLGEIAVLSLDPFGKPVPDLPVGLTDYATSVRVHGDQIIPERSPGDAFDGQSADQLVDAARAVAAAVGLTPTDRVWSAGSWATSELLTTNLLAVFAAGASLVQVANPDPAAQDRRRATEKVTRSLS